MVWKITKYGVHKFKDRSILPQANGKNLLIL